MKGTMRGTKLWRRLCACGTLVPFRRSGGGCGDDESQWDGRDSGGIIAIMTSAVTRIIRFSCDAQQALRASSDASSKRESFLYRGRMTGD